MSSHSRKRGRGEESVNGIIPEREPAVKSTVCLNVGGRVFKVAIATLQLAGGPYLNALLSNNWKDAEEEGEFFIDRDSDSFAVILSFLRSGCKLLKIDEGDKKLFSSVLLDAEFFGIDSLLNFVKLTCFKNMGQYRFFSPPKPLKDAEMIEKFDKEFKTINDLLNSRQFPSCFFKKFAYNRIISVETLPSDAYVEIYNRGTDETKFLATLQMVTFENYSGQIFTEPMVNVNVSRFLCWTFYTYPYCFGEANTHDVQKLRAQVQKIIPISYALALDDDSSTFKTWHLASKKVYLTNEGANLGSYTADIGGRAQLCTPSLIEVFQRNEMGGKKTTVMYGTNVYGKLTEVSKFSNFKYLGEEARSHH